MKTNATVWKRSVWATLGFLALLSIAGDVYAAKLPPSAPIDINKASIEDLMKIPGVGQAKAQAIVAYRQTMPFASTDELVNVKGIGEKMLAVIAPYVTVTGTTQKNTAGTAEKAVH